MNSSDEVARCGFDDDMLASGLDRLDADALHALPFGVIRLDADGAVAFYSSTEARQSGRGDLQTVGLDFYGSVAPCMANDDFRGRIERHREQGSLDIEIGHTGDFSDRHRLLRVRAMSAENGGVWLAIQR